MKKKEIIKKFVIIMLIVIFIMNFIIPNRAFARKFTWIRWENGALIIMASEADGSEDISDGGVVEAAGGILLNPLVELVLAVFDAINSTMQKIMLSDESNNGEMSNIIEATSGSFNIMTEEIRDVEFDNGNLSDEEYLDVSIYQKAAKLKYPHIHYSCEEIFSGKIGLLNIDFISGNGQSKGLANVRNVIASWYRALRLIAIVGFLSVLIYTGIKIMTSSIAQDKAKYKEWIINWIIGFAILFFLHYIMSFIISIIGQFTKLLSNSMQYIPVHFYKENTIGGTEDTFVTNLIGLVRFLAQSSVPTFKVGYLILYVMLTTYTIKFTIVYLKRLINMAFLTLIAPIVAFTYPIDKMADGQAQGFDAWLKEYIFNALLQPMHLLLYYILVGSSVMIAAKNPLYAIVVLAFMTEGERLLKKIFGFDKANGFGTVKGMQDAIIGSTIASKMVGMLGKGKGNVDEGKMPSPGATNKDFSNAGLDMGNSGTLPQQSQNNGNNQQQSNSNGNNQQQNSNSQQRQNAHRVLQPPVLSGIKTNSPKEKSTFQQMADKVKGSDAGKAISQMANTKAGRGVRAVGRKIVRPVWDTQKTAKWNKKRLKRKLLKGAVGTAVGVTAAAVQAGISLTDGKYNPLEGVTAFGAGFAFAGNKTEGLVNTFEEGYNDHLMNNDLSDEEKNEKLERYQEDFKNRDDVIDFCKQNYGKDWKEYRDRMSDNFVSRGCTDLKEMKEMMKYSNKMYKESGIDGRNDLTDEQKAIEREKLDASAVAIKNIQKQKAKEGTLKSVYDFDAEDEEILAKTAGMGKDEAEAEAKKIRDRNAAIRWYQKKLNE